MEKIDSQVESSFQERYISLRDRMNERGQVLTENNPLYNEAVQLLFDAVVAGPQEKEMATTSYSLVNRFKPITPTLPEAIEERLFEIFGAVSQFTHEVENSSCTSCAMAFLRYVLPTGVAWDLQESQITNYVKIGKALHNHLQESIEKQKSCMSEEDTENLEQEVWNYQAFSSNEVVGYFDLKIMSALPSRQIPENTVEFFRERLTALQNELTPQKPRVGAIIHCRDYTYALIIFDTIRGREFVFFDSHGNGKLNGGNTNAYAKYTFSLETMAKFLAQLLPYKPLEVDSDVLAAIQTSGERASLESEANKYICYVIDLKDNQAPVLVEDDPQEKNKIEEREEPISTAEVEPSDPSKGESDPSSRIHFFALGFFALCAAACLYTYRHSLMSCVTIQFTLPY